jgi:hypothetical protein
MRSASEKAAAISALRNETHRNRLGILPPVTSRAPRIISFNEPLWDAEKRSY